MYLKYISNQLKLQIWQGRGEGEFWGGGSDMNDKIVAPL